MPEKHPHAYVMWMAQAETMGVSPDVAATRWDQMQAKKDRAPRAPDEAKAQGAA